MFDLKKQESLLTKLKSSFPVAVNEIATWSVKKLFANNLQPKPTLTEFLKHCVLLQKWANFDDRELLIESEVHKIAENINTFF